MRRDYRMSYHLIVWPALLLSFTLVVPAKVAAQESSVDVRTRETEQGMTDEERFSLLYSLYPINPIDDKNARLSDMVRRILHSIAAVGVDQPLAPPTIDLAQPHATALEVARQGIVLLKNDGVLPLASDTRRITVIDGFAPPGRAVG